MVLSPPSEALTPIAAFRRIAASRPSAPAFRADDTRLCFADLAAETAALAAYLRGAGVRRGDLVAVLPATARGGLTAFLAIMHLGAVHCSLAHLGGASIDLAPRWLLGEGATVARLEALLPEVPALDLAAAPANASPPPVADIGPDHVAQIILTSGTTGRAKLVPLSFAVLAARTALRSRYYPTLGGVLSLMSPATAGGCQAAISTLLDGHPLDLSATPEGWAAAVADPGIAHIVASPVQLAGLLAQGPGPAAGMRGVLLMGGAVPASLAGAAEAALGCPLLSMYGTTELGACAIRSVDTEEALRPLPGVRVAVTDDAGRPLPDGETGHLRVIAPGMALEYHDDPVQTLRQFRDGWFLPGDLARLHGGMIHLAGRADEVINIGGVKLDPSAFDRLIADRGLASEAAAFRFGEPGRGERLMIASVTDSDAAFDRLRSEIAAAVAGRFPVGHYRVDAIPRNEMGKPLRRVLAERLARQVQAQASVQS